MSADQHSPTDLTDEQWQLMDPLLHLLYLQA